jgi:hypothetical protein
MMTTGGSLKRGRVGEDPQSTQLSTPQRLRLLYCLCRTTARGSRKIPGSSHATVGHPPATTDPPSCGLPTSGQALGLSCAVAKAPIHCKRERVPVILQAVAAACELSQHIHRGPPAVGVLRLMQPSQPSSRISLELGIPMRPIN